MRDLRLYLFTRLMAWLPMEIRSPAALPLYVINPSIHKYPKFHPFLVDHQQHPFVLRPNPHGLHRSTHPSLVSWDRGKGSPRNYEPVFPVVFSGRNNMYQVAVCHYTVAEFPIQLWLFSHPGNYHNMRQSPSSSWSTISPSLWFTNHENHANKSGFCTAYWTN